MSDDQLAEETAESAEDLKEAESTEETPAFDYGAHQEETASKSGWRDLDEFTKNGGDPKDWTSAEFYNVKRMYNDKLNHKLNEQERSFDVRVANLNQMHMAQMSVQLKELNKKKEEAIEQADVEGVKNIDHQMSTLANSANQPVTTQVDPLIEKWNSDNPWINELGAKSTYAKSLYGQATAAGYTPSQIVSYVNREIAKEFPKNSPSNAPTVSISEGGSRPGKSVKSKGVTMGDVTAEEHKMRSFLGGSATDDKVFLQMVTDSRKAE